MDEVRDLEERLKVLAGEQRKRIEREKRLRGQSRVFGKKPEQHRRAAEEVAFLARLILVIDEHRATLRGRVVSELVTAIYYARHRELWVLPAQDFRGRAVKKTGDELAQVRNRACSRGR